MYDEMAVRSGCGMHSPVVPIFPYERMTPTVRIRILPVIAAGLLLCGIGLFWPSSVKRRQFTVAVNVWPGTEGVLSARQTEGFNKTPVSFVEFSWSAAVMGAFQKRVVDAAVVSLDELLLLEEGEAQPLAVLVVGTSRGSDAILARPGISAVSDLRGRRVGVELHSSSEYFLTSSLQKQGMALPDVEVVPLNLAETESAYLEKDIDAVATADPWRVRLLDAGAIPLDDSKSMGLEMSRVLVVRRDTAGTFHDEVGRLVSACLEHAGRKGPSWEVAGQAAVLRRQGLSRAQWEAALGVVHTPGLEENVRLLQGGLAEVLQQVASRMRASGALERDVGLSHLTSSQFVKEDGK